VSDTDDSSTCLVHVAAKIDIKNQCSYDITACDEATSRVTCYVLTGGSQSQVEIDVGATWSGTIWGLPSSLGDGSLGYQAMTQANLAEFSINSNSTDFYDLSNVVSFPNSTKTCMSMCPNYLIPAANL
jgi:hypothetical protein